MAGRKDDVQKDVQFTVVSNPGWEAKENKGTDYWKYSCDFGGQKRTLVLVPQENMQAGDAFTADLSSWDYQGKTFYRAVDMRGGGQKHPSEQPTAEREKPQQKFDSPPPVSSAILSDTGRTYMKWCVAVAKKLVSIDDAGGPAFVSLVATTCIFGEKHGIPAALVREAQGQDKEERRRTEDEFDRQERREDVPEERERTEPLPPDEEIPF